METLCLLEPVEERGAERPAGAIPLAFEGQEILLSGLVDAVDAEAEQARLGKLVADLERQIGGFTGKLSNEGYVAKAPPAIVEETRAKLARAEAELAAARSALADLP